MAFSTDLKRTRWRKFQCCLCINLLIYWGHWLGSFKHLEHKNLHSGTVSMKQLKSIEKNISIKSNSEGIAERQWQSSSFWFSRRLCKFLLLFFPHAFNFRHRSFSSLISQCTNREVCLFICCIKELPEILVKPLHIRTLMQGRNRDNLFGSASWLCPEFWNANPLFLMFGFNMASPSQGLLHRRPGAVYFFKFTDYFSATSAV